MFLVVASAPAQNQNGPIMQGDTAIVIEDFSDQIDNATGLPRRLRVMGKETGIYSVVNEGTLRYLRARTAIASTTVARFYEFNPLEFPILTWRWLVRSLPVGASEQRKKLNDSGASILLVFKDSGPWPRTIKYVWSTTLQKNLRFDSPTGTNTKIIVLQSGTGMIGRWVTERIDVARDFKSSFGGDSVPPVKMIGILSDADDTKTAVDASYADFRIVRGESGAASVDSTRENR